jgi:hypothetical protein
LEIAMSRVSHTLLVAALLAAAAGAPTLTSAQAPQNPPAAAAGMKGNADHMAAMDAQMKTMREMHDKMVNAKTPEERNALMAEHMKAMQGGMATMGMMGGAGIGGMAGMGAMQGGKPMAGDMNQRQQMMEKRMEMMHSMMQMMMDRMPATPAK